ncbi:hypothetical protein BDV95DRAFT_600289 [Massariosphaeria phaeospora]|uniref:Uncharacterized protein n=1 Tax=Massariosphaeria phaeospora TaxID=100035 RepID=A0A7C8I4D9_9PLEO|nr:hypothetical protein BDV95DRAFT_600289 [Massariosphaeria phaeospora]
MFRLWLFVVSLCCQSVLSSAAASSTSATTGSVSATSSSVSATSSSVSATSSSVSATSSSVSATTTSTSGTISIKTQSKTAPGVERDAVPTFPIKNLQDYFPSSFNVPDATGRDVRLHPTGIFETFPASGIEISFGPDLLSDLSKAASQDSCQDPFSDACKQSVLQVLQEPGRRLQARTGILRPSRIQPLTLLLTLNWYLRVAWNMTYWNHHEPQPPPVFNPKAHIKVEDLERLGKVKGESKVVFETASDDTRKMTATITATSSSTAAAYPTVSVLTADIDDHKVGDLLIHFPEDTAERLSDFITQIGFGHHVCPHFRKASSAGQATSFDLIQLCPVEFARAGEYILEAAGKLGYLALINFNQPDLQLNKIRFKLEHLAVGVEALAYAAAKMPELQGYNTKVKSVLARTVFLTVLAASLHLDDLYNQRLALQDVYLAKTEFEIKDENDNDDDDEEEEEITCDIKADASPMSPGKYKGCRCVEWMKSYYPHQYPTSNWEAQGELLDMLVSDALQNSLSQLKPVCDSQKLVAVEIAWWNEQVALFCKEAKSLKQRNHFRTEAHSYTFAFNWVDVKEDCNFSCDEMFSRFNQSTPCRYNSHVMAESGMIQSSSGCGTVQYRVFQKPTPSSSSSSSSPPPPPPTPLPTRDIRYILKVHQEMERANSHIEWELFGDHNGLQLGGPSREGLVTGCSHPVKINVRDPTNIKKTVVDFSYLNVKGTIMSTGGTGLNWDDRLHWWKNYCAVHRDEAKWRPKNAGFERNFKCYFNDNP